MNVHYLLVASRDPGMHPSTSSRSTSGIARHASAPASSREGSRS
jgi:hypothetical protein